MKPSQFTPQELALASAQAKTRALAIKNNKRRQIIDNMQQQQARLANFTDALVVSPILDYSTVVAEDRALQKEDIEHQHFLFLQNMSRIADAKTSAAIKSKLNDNQIIFANASFSDLYREVITTFQKQKVAPAVFTSFLLKYLSNKMSNEIDAGVSFNTDYPQVEAEPVDIDDGLPVEAELLEVRPKKKASAEDQARKEYVDQIWESKPNKEAWAFVLSHTKKNKLLKKNLLKFSIEELEKLHTALAENGFVANAKVASEDAAMEGRGFRKRGAWKHRRVIHGRGVDPEAAQAKKYYLDLKMLRAGQLCVKYVSTSQFKIKPTPINRDVEGVLMDIVKQDFNQRLYDKLKPADKKIIQYFVRTMKLDDEIPIRSDDLEKTFEDWEIYRGEYMGGNNSPEVRAGLRRTTLELANMKRISTSTCHQILAVLGASG